MPRSKRNKVVSLTKTGPKGRDLKTKYVESIRDAVDEYKNVFVFSYTNMRARPFKDIRVDWRDSRMFMGKNSVAKVALGRTPEEEYKDNLRHVGNKLEGNVGMLFTNKKKKETLKYFKNFHPAEFAKAGAIPNEDIILEPTDLSFQPSMLDQFRKLGMIVEINNGVIQLRSSFTAAEAGVPLTPEQAKVLVHFNMPIVDFKIGIECLWSDGEFEEF